MNNPQNFDDEEDQENGADKKFEPDCDIVLKKCFGELLGILIYVVTLFIFIIGVVQIVANGKPVTAVIEFLVAFGIDQVKSIPFQFVIWWIIVRRCGKFEPSDYKEWEDEQMFLEGSDLSLFDFLRL